MIGERSRSPRRGRVGRTINRDYSPFLANALPLATILAGSLAPMLPIIATGPMVPPIGFMTFLAWRFVRPGLLPLWIGAPLGAFDDLFSGQPFGCAIMLWSLAMLGLEALEARFPWRGFWQDWITAAGMLIAYVVLCALLAGIGMVPRQLMLLIPQLLLSVLLFPIIARMVALFDRLRLRRVRILR